MMKYLALVAAMVAAVGMGYLLKTRPIADAKNPPAAVGAIAQTDLKPAVSADSAMQASASVYVYDPKGKLVGPVQSPTVRLTAEQWKKRLSPAAFDVLRNQGTELPNSGEYVDSTDDGVYCCAGCGLPLFSSDAKFHSGTGWPSFYQPITKENVAQVRDTSYGMVRNEIRCPRCGGHLGHVFDDGPQPTGLRYCLDSVALKFTPRAKLASLADPAADAPRHAAAAKPKTATAVFASGCFWCAEAAFDQIKGVVHVTSGYSGGEIGTANYETVSGGNTGHAESIQVTYNPARVSYDQLLDVFFASHDPTEIDRQGNDVGKQYRSAIFYADDAQRRAAEAKIQALTRSHAFPDPIVTAVEPLKAFYPAEDYHQNYVHNHPNDPYVQGVSLPRVEQVQKKLPELIKKGD
jgi:peptide methionine sulfoxide reductase msrA/msrB